MEPVLPRLGLRHFLKPDRRAQPGGALLRVLTADTGPVTERLRVREIDDDEGQVVARANVA
jgi:hypothetical protein